ncbi:hypothetical protein DFH29DRAFT_615845 [Suillus ampliporus]|nr:hypothetical protein DFH29DRAFT_615845 [Suillus ampliporus]
MSQTLRYAQVNCIMMFSFIQHLLQGNQMDKGDLRVDFIVDFRGATSYGVTYHVQRLPSDIRSIVHGAIGVARLARSYPRLNFNLKPPLSSMVSTNSEERVRKAWDEGKIADEDVPETERMKRSPRRGHTLNPRKTQVSTPEFSFRLSESYSIVAR